MKFLYAALVVAAALAVRLTITRARRRRRAARQAGETVPGVQGPGSLRPGWWRAVESSIGDVGLVAGREIRERIHGRIFRVGTAIMLIAVAAVIIVPKVEQSAGPTIQRIGIVGALSPDAREVVLAAGKVNHDTVKFEAQSSLTTARKHLRSGKIDFAIIDSDEILLYLPVGSSKSPADAGLVRYVAEYLGVLKTYQKAGLSLPQMVQVSHAEPIAVRSIQPSAKGTTQATSLTGLVLMFFMLTQYCTWILIGVMQEKSSRVVEVLLAMVRPIQLLGGKVLGIGLVALGQATLIVGFALVLGAAVGSDLLKGTGPVAVLAELLWLVLGYAFYCWVYAAAGSTAERQDQVQTLALPLSLPILVGYVYSITVASSGAAPSLVFRIFAYLPPTAPFCMSVLVGLSQVTWWEFVASVLVSIASTVVVALFAAGIYRRAVLRTGARVRIRELLG